MAGVTESGGSRNWADFLAIITGVALLAISIWPGEPTAGADAAREQGNLELAWYVRMVVGAMAILAVVVAQKWERRPIARGLLLLGALALLANLLIFRDFGPRALLSLVLPAAALLLASTAIGPMPRGVERVTDIGHRRD